MSLVKVIALKDHEWAKVQRHPGDTYVCDTEDDRFNALLVMGLAKYVSSVEDLRPQQPTRYNRRDLRAKH